MRELPLNFVRGDAFGGGIFKYMSLTPGSYRYEGLRPTASPAPAAFRTALSWTARPS